MMNMLLITRVHYTIDIAAGLVFAVFMSKNVNRFVPWADKIISLPLLLGEKGRDWCRERQRKKEEEELALNDVNARLVE